MATIGTYTLARSSRVIPLTIRTEPPVESGIVRRQWGVQGLYQRGNFSLGAVLLSPERRTTSVADFTAASCSTADPKTAEVCLADMKAAGFCNADLNAADCSLADPRNADVERQTRSYGR